MPVKEHGKYSVLAALLLAQIIGPLDASMLRVALPTVAEEFGVSISAAGWVLVAYLLLSCSLMVIFGRIGDVLGRRRLFVLGTGIFTAGSVLGGLSVNFTMLLVTRAIMGLGDAMFASNLPALVTGAFPPEERGKALGITATTVAAGLTVGPILGGLVTGALGWRYVLFVTPPFGIAAIMACLSVVPESRGEGGRSLDIAGALLLLGALAPLVMALSRGGARGWGSASTTGLFAASVVMAFIFVLHERKTGHPVIDLRLFRIPGFTFSNLASFASYVSMQAVTFATPFFLQYSIGMSSQGLGLVMCVVNFTSIFLLSASGRLSDRTGPVPLETAGLALFTVSTGMLAWAGADLTLFLIVLSLVVLGIGYGIFRSPNYSDVMGSVPPARLGVAGGFYGTMRSMGFMTGIAMAGSVMGSWALKRPEAVIYTDPSFQSAVRNAYMAAFVIAVIALLLILLKYFYRQKKTVTSV